MAGEGSGHAGDGGLEDVSDAENFYDLREYAAQYVTLGYAVFPCLQGKKQPATKHGFKDGSRDAATVQKMWRTVHLNIGLPTGEINNVWALDIDGEIGEETFNSLILANGELPVTPEQKTGKGRQIFFRYDNCGIRNTAKYLGAGLDARGEGGYCVVGPSLHPNGNRYHWLDDRLLSKTPLAVAPDWLIRMALKEDKEPVTRQAVAPAATDGTERYVAAALIEESNKVARAGEGQRNDTLNQAAFSLGTLVGAGALQEHLAVGNLKASAAAAGLDPVEIEKTIASGMAAGRAQPRKMPETRQRSRPHLTVVGPAVEGSGGSFGGGSDDSGPQGPSDNHNDNWRRFLIMKMTEKKGSHPDPKAMTNCCVFLTHHEDIRGLFAYDEFADRVILTRCPRWTKDEGEIWQPKSLQDVDITRAMSWLEWQEMSPRFTDVNKAIVSAAHRNTINPVLDYLANLNWDGKSRLDNWLSYYLGVRPDEYSKLVGAKWLISAVARVFNPGCQVDTMLILEGPQGIGKSKALRILATLGDISYFTDDLSDLGNKDTIMQMQGVIIAEIAELAAMLKKDQEDVKAFLSRRVDRYRPPYGANVIERPRRCVLAGTMNPGAISYLKDETGGRRFWPVKTTAVDAASLATDRDQLWAEAVSRYRGNERFWLTDHEIDLAVKEQEERQEEDPWEQDISEIMNDVHSDIVSAAFILKKLGLDASQRNTLALRRLSKYMPRIGWHKAKQRVDGSANPVSVYVREAEENKHE